MRREGGRVHRDPIGYIWSSKPTQFLSEFFVYSSQFGPSTALKFTIEHNIVHQSKNYKTGPKSLRDSLRNLRHHS